MHTSRRWRDRVRAALYLTAATLFALAVMAAALIAIGVLPLWVGTLMVLAGGALLLATWRPHDPSSYPEDVFVARLLAATYAWAGAAGVATRLTALIWEGLAS